MATKLISFLLYFIVFRIQGTFSLGNNTQKELIDYLFANDSLKNLLPVENYSQAVNVEFGVQLIKIKDVNAKEQTIQVHVWVYQKWTNPFLKWDTERFPGITTINVKPDSVWVPDIVLYHNVDEQDRTGGGTETYKTLVKLFHNGTNVWTSPALFKAICEVDVSFFPLDQQNCMLKFGSWTYPSTQLTLTDREVKFPSRNYIKNGEWGVYSVKREVNTLKYDYGNEEYVDFTLHISMKREYLDYMINLVIPCLMISCMTFLGFILPPESGERVGLSITVLLAMTVFQQLTSEIMPSYGFPLLGQYYFATILEIGLALLITTVILNFYHRTNRHMPRWLRILLLDWMARLVFLHESAEKYINPRRKTLKRGIRENIDAVINNGYALGERPLNNDVSGGNRGPFENGNSHDVIEENNMIGKTQSDQNVLKLTLGSIGNELTPNTQNERGLFTDETGAAVSEEEMRTRHQQWTLAAKILDRFFLWGSGIVGLFTVLVIFLRAPGIWDNQHELQSTSQFTSRE